jgi:hypothetical protein
VATLAGGRPTDYPQAEPLDLEEQNRVLAKRGLRLEVVVERENWGETAPSGKRIALLDR